MQALVSVQNVESHGENNPELAAAFVEALNDPEINHLLEHPDSRPGSVSLPSDTHASGTRKHSISSLALPAITAVTGRLDVRVIGCEGLLQVFPAGLFKPGSASGTRARTRLVDAPSEFSAKLDERPGLCFGNSLFLLKHMFYLIDYPVFF